MLWCVKSFSRNVVVVFYIQKETKSVVHWVVVCFIHPTKIRLYVFPTTCAKREETRGCLSDYHSELQLVLITESGRKKQ